MKDVEMERKIKQAIEHAAPDCLASVISDCEKQKGTVIMMNENTKKKRSWVKYVAGIAACLLLVMGGVFGANFYGENYALASTVSLDVNPSVQIKVNSNEKVLEVVPLNEDGEKIVGDMVFKGSGVDVAVNALIGSMLSNGYLNELSNSILISVDSKDPAKGEALQAKLAAEAESLLNTQNFTGSVLSQSIVDDDDIREAAEKYGITEGKARLISEILKKNAGHTFEELVPLTINELNLIMGTHGTQIEGVSSTGEASDKAYIGTRQAKSIALKHAGVAEADITDYEFGMDTEMGLMVYEIDFSAKGYEYEYDIDALTGDIIKSDREADDDYADKSAQSSELIGAQKAKSIALTHAGVSAADATDLEVELDMEGGVKVYEVSFDAKGYEYDYEINALTGDIVKSDREADDDYVAPSRPVSGGTGLIGEAKAKSIALTHAGVSASAVTEYDAELDYENGAKVYELEFKAGGYEYDYTVNAATGAVMKHEKEADDDYKAPETQQPQTSSLISKEKAKSIALSHAGLSASAVTKLKVELDSEDGVKVYEVEFEKGNTEYSYEINASSGRIISFDKEIDD